MICAAFDSNSANSTRSRPRASIETGGRMVTRLAVIRGSPSPETPQRFNGFDPSPGAMLFGPLTQRSFMVAKSGRGDGVVSSPLLIASERSSPRLAAPSDRSSTSRIEAWLAHNAAAWTMILKVSPRAIAAAMSTHAGTSATDHVGDDCWLRSPKR